MTYNRFTGSSLHATRFCACCRDYRASAGGQYVPKTRTTQEWRCARCVAMTQGATA